MKSREIKFFYNNPFARTIGLSELTLSPIITNHNVLNMLSTAWVINDP